MNDVRAFLAGLAGEVLVDLVMAQAKKRRLRQQLLMKAARRGPRGLIFGHAQFVRSTAPSKPADSSSTAPPAATLEESMTPLTGSRSCSRKACGRGHRTYRACARVGGALDGVGRIDGAMGGICSASRRFITPRARRRPRTPRGWRRGSSSGSCGRTGARSSGPPTRMPMCWARRAGRHGEPAQGEWARVPALKAGHDDPSKNGFRFRITQIMEALARRSGDVEALVAVKERESAYAYLEIAEAYLKVGQQIARCPGASAGSAVSLPDRLQLSRICRHRVPPEETPQRGMGSRGPSSPNHRAWNGSSV